MTDTGALSADAFVDAHLPPERQALVGSAFTALGVSASIRVLPPRRGGSDLQWLVLVALPMQAFITGLGTRVAEDAYRKFQDTIRRLFRQEPAGQGLAAAPMVLQDTASGLRIVLDHDLPPEGYQQLLTLDLERFRLGPVHYDRAQRKWRSELDEAESAANPPSRGTKSP